jgi:hypothetical protein
MALRAPLVATLWLLSDHGAHAATVNGRSLGLSQQSVLRKGVYGFRGCLYSPAYPGFNEVWRILSNWNTCFSPKQKLDNLKYCLNEIRKALEVI